MPVVVWRVGHDANGVVENRQHAFGVFDDDGGTRCIGHDVMQRQGSSEFLLDVGIAHHLDACWIALPHFIDVLKLPSR